MNLSMGYTNSAIKGFSWVGLLRLFIRGLNFIRMAILAHFLTPDQFGMFGIAALMLGFIEMITETGVNVVLIQEKDTQAIDDYVDTAWSVSILRGAMIALILCLASPLMSNFFHNSASLPILLMVALVPFIRGFINPAIVKFQKTLHFDKEFYFRAVITLVEAIVSISLAILLHSPVSLVWGLAISALTEVCLSFLFVAPRPHWHFDPGQFQTIFHRGKWITLTGTLNYLYVNGPDMTIGKLLNASSLGIYQMAFRFGYTPVSELGDVSNRVTFPIFVAITGDKLRARIAYFKNTLLLTLIMAPVMLVLIFFPHLIVQYVLGPNWLGVIPLLPLMGFTVFIASLTAPASSLLLAMKRQNQVFYINLIRTAALWVVVIPLINSHGVAGGAMALLISALIALPYTIFQVFRALV
jgi:lipopolysaccharide exporter